MIDIPNVYKLGKGPEQGHVNCSFFMPCKNLEGPGLEKSSYDDVIKITEKMSHMSVYNYLGLHLSVAPCIVRDSTTEKEK
jgi:hypothetical protein